MHGRAAPTYDAERALQRVAWERRARGHRLATADAQREAVARRHRPPGTSGGAGCPWTVRVLVASLVLLSCACASAARVRPIGARAAARAERRAAAPPCAPAFAAPRLPAGAVEVLYAHPERAWLAVCHHAGEGASPVLRHAHHGESPVGARPVLLRPDREPLAVDRFVTVDPTARWLLVARGGDLVLLDKRVGDGHALRPLHAGDDPMLYTIAFEHPIASFDARGEQLAYLRWDENGPVAVVRQLESAEEHEVSAPPGHRLLGARLDRGGAWLWLYGVRSDRAVVRWRRLGGSSRQCDPPRSPQGWDEGVPAAPRRSLVRHAVSIAALSAPGERTYVESASAAAGADLVVRGSDGALELRDSAGSVRELVEAACDPLGLRVASAGDGLAVLCRASGDVRFYERAPEGLRLAVTYTPSSPVATSDAEWARSRWLWLGQERVIDLETGESMRVPAGAEIIASARGRLVYRGDDGALGVASEAGAVTVPELDRSDAFWRGTFGPFVLVGEGVVDVLTGRYGVTTGYPWQLHPSGHALVTTEETPLAWEPIHFTERPCACRTAGE